MRSSNKRLVEIGAAILAFGNDRFEKLPHGSKLNARLVASFSLDM